MTAGRHLILQELKIPPTVEQFPYSSGWTIGRVAEGNGYWLQRGQPTRELDVGDVFVAAPNSDGVIRASSLGAVKLQFYGIQPQLLGGLLTVSEWQQFETIASGDGQQVTIFSAKEPPAQKFSKLVGMAPQGSLPARCRFLQLWADAVAQLMPPVPEQTFNKQLRERFREMVGQMSEAELCVRSLDELAGQLGCSERHFRRLFREEFGTPLRKRQTELRLLRARQFLAESDAKIINVAYDSGYHHLGLFNSLFKKNFGMTPSEWRRQARKTPIERRRRLTTRVGTALTAIFFGMCLTSAYAQTSSTNAATGQTPPATTPKTFSVQHYLVSGNSLLPPERIGAILGEATGEHVSADEINTAKLALQQEYRNRGYMTVAALLPPQTISNATVKIQVTEAPLVAINVIGNDHFSSNNVMRALPSLHTNMMLNSFVFQRELDSANANRDRQIYPVVGPGPLPGTSALTLRVKDRFPLHAHLELNNQSTPATPETRVSFSAQYNNLWGHEHQVGFQYGFSPDSYKLDSRFAAGPFDEPLIANYSVYYRIPLGSPVSLQDQIDADPLAFGYSETTHQFRLPAPSDRPSLTVYASRATVDTGVQFGDSMLVADVPLLKVVSQDSGENLTLNEAAGARLSVPLRPVAGIKSTLSFGIDFKRYQLASFNTNNFYETITTSNAFGQFTTNITISSGQPAYYQRSAYLPLNVGLDFSIPDKFGVSYFNVGANFNPLGFLTDEAFIHKIAHPTNAPAYAYNTNTPTGIHPHYITVNMGFNREQKIYKNWTVLLRANGQWSDTPLIGNEQFALGGVTSVRGYHEGEVYGDTGWRVSIEPRTPLVNVGPIRDGAYEAPLWMRGSAFVDYGETYSLNSSASKSRFPLCGVGVAGTASIGSHCDARLTIAYPLLDSPTTKSGDVRVNFSLAFQF